MHCTFKRLTRVQDIHPSLLGFYIIKLKLLFYIIKIMKLIKLVTQLPESRICLLLLLLLLFHH